MQKAVKEFADHYQLLDALIAEENKLFLADDDVTVSRVVKQSKWNRSLAIRMINEWVKAGKLEPLGKRREPSRGQMVDAWRMKC